jgi:hypothetical protein
MANVLKRGRAVRAADLQNRSRYMLEKSAAAVKELVEITGV